MKIKPLTFGQAIFHPTRLRKISWRVKVLNFSEKQDSIFWEINGNLFCSFSEDGLPFLEAVKQDEILNDEFSIYQIEIESMNMKKMLKTYPATIGGLFEAKEDLKNRKLNSKFLSRSKKILFKNQSK